MKTASLAVKRETLAGDWKDIEDTVQLVVPLFYPFETTLPPLGHPTKVIIVTLVHQLTRLCLSSHPFASWCGEWGEMLARRKKNLNHQGALGNRVMKRIDLCPAAELCVTVPSIILDLFARNTVLLPSSLAENHDINLAHITTKWFTQLKWAWLPAAVLTHGNRQWNSIIKNQWVKGTVHDSVQEGEHCFVFAT